MDGEAGGRDDVDPEDPGGREDPTETGAVAEEPVGVERTERVGLADVPAVDVSAVDVPTPDEAGGTPDPDEAAGDSSARTPSVPPVTVS